MSGPLQVLVDGEQATADWPMDRALQYGDGLFETLTVRDGRMRFELLHRQRLDAGCRRLGIAVDAATLWRRTGEVAAAHGQCTPKVLVTRGSSPARGYTPPASANPRILHMVFPAPAVAEIPAHVGLVTLRAALGENPALAGLKHCNRLEQVMGRMELQHTRAFEGLMGSSSGCLISGTMSNVFISHGEEFVTPVLDQCGVAGVMRAVVMREAQGCGLTIREQRVSLAALRECSAAFITNARMGVVIAHAMDGRALQATPAVARLAEQVRALAA